MIEQPHATRKMSGATKSLRESLRERAAFRRAKERMRDECETPARQLALEYESIRSRMACAADLGEDYLVIDGTTCEAVCKNFELRGIRITHGPDTTRFSWE